MEDENPVESVGDDLHEHAHQSKERWIMGVALTAALIAALAAVANSFSAHHESHGVLEQLKASDQWAYYQAKGIKNDLEESRADLLDNFGKHEEAAKAREKARDLYYDQYKIKHDALDAQEQSEKHMKLHSTYANGVTFAQIAIAISAISVLVRKKVYWYVGLVFGVIALGFVIKGIIG